ncbi:MAG: hypothetical protein AAF962_06960 [Actinomycetota bacterium]
MTNTTSNTTSGNTTSDGATGDTPSGGETSSGGEVPAIDSVRLSLPKQWVQVAAERGRIDDLLATTLANIESEGITLPKTEIRRLEASFGQLRRYILDKGIAGLAVFADLFRHELDEPRPKTEPVGAGADASVGPGGSESAGSEQVGDVEGEPFLVSATMAIVHLDKRRLGTELSLSPKSLALILSRTRPNEPEERPAHRFTALEPPALIDLPAGPTTVLKQVLEYRPSVVESTSLFTQSYFVSPPEAEGERVTLLQFASPNVDLAPSLSRLFEAIAKTFVFLREGDESLPPR